MKKRPSTPLLDCITSVEELRKLPGKKLPQLAGELRAEVIDAVSETGGHLGAGLGVVELTIALHYVFETPVDRLIWDVGHQTYPHKILTGRRNKIRTLRREHGLSGFTKRRESQFDPFGAGHSSTSVSAGLGMAVAGKLKGEQRNVIAVVGDGAVSAGMAYEAMNNAGAMDARLIVVLNDNDMSIDRPTGALSAYLARRKSGVTAGCGNVFEALGFEYSGPVNGHDLPELVEALQAVREMASSRPVLVHVQTQKGKGYAPAETSIDKFHGVSRFNVSTGSQAKPVARAPTYTSVFADSLIEEAKLDDHIVAITAAMPSGTGLDRFARQFDARCFDVGIAEQHAVTFAAGMATEGLRPFCAIYSTFLQRGYDQVIHDVAIQNLPVRFAIDRAGFVGADGPTHAGVFDTAFLGTIPNMVLMAAGDEADLKHMVRTAARFDEHPIAFRYPRGEGTGIELPVRGNMLEIGKGRIIREGTDVAFLSYGGRLEQTLKAAEMLAVSGVSATVADARFAKPLDTDLIKRLVREHAVLIPVEEGSIGGFCSFVMTWITLSGLLDSGTKFHPLFVPDRHFDHAAQDRMYAHAGLDSNAIAAIALRLMGKETEACRLAAGQVDI